MGWPSSVQQFPFSPAWFVQRVFGLEALELCSLVRPGPEQSDMALVESFERWRQQ